MNFNFDLAFNSQASNPSSFYSGLGFNSRHPPLATFKDQIFKEDLYFSDEEENGGPVLRLPLFGRDPLTNRAYLDTGLNAAASGNNIKSQNFSLRSQENEGVVASKHPRVSGDGSNHANRIPLLQISNQLCNIDMNKPSSSPKKISWSQIAKRPATGVESVLPLSPAFSSPDKAVSPSLPTFEEIAGGRPRTNMSAAEAVIKKPLAAVKPSLDDVKDDSIVALTNKHGKGKYWFKSGCPTPDPRWPARQQLMIGPIPGDVEYATLRSAFLSKGHTIHLFIQNNQAWLEKNQEKFGKKQVKFGYVVYTEPEVARRLLSSGFVMVGHAKVAVKEMDGQPAVFSN